MIYNNKDYDPYFSDQNSSIITRIQTELKRISSLESLDDLIFIVVPGITNENEVLFSLDSRGKDMSAFNTIIENYLRNSIKGLTVKGIKFDQVTPVNFGPYFERVVKVYEKIRTDHSLSTSIPCLYINSNVPNMIVPEYTKIFARIVTAVSLYCYEKLDI